VAEFEVPLADLEEGEKALEWSVPEKWLVSALAGTEAAPRGAAGTLALRLRKDGRQVMVRGRLEAELVMPCARTLRPVDVPVRAEVFLLLSPASGEAPASRGKRSGRGKRARSAELLTEQDAARDTYSGDRVVLDEFVREFLLLELPMMPLHPDAPPAIGPVPGGPTPVDPRLAPLGEIAGRLRKQE
jgi:uncharacterized metal-binding protein YceD (DUF177 family)